MYDTEKLSDINTERFIPANTVVDVVLKDVRLGNTKQDGTGSPKIELDLKVQSGPFANFVVRENLWIATVAKEGKDKPPFKSQALPTIIRLYKAVTNFPKAINGPDGAESAESKALRAPATTKLDAFLSGCKTPEQLRDRIATLSNKPLKIKVKTESFNGKEKNVVGDFMSAAA